MRIHRLAIAIVACCLIGSSAFAQAVKIEFRDGKVTLTAQNAPLRTILSEWSRLGGTQMVNVEKIAGAPVTLQLTNVPETQALDIILRGTAGYLLGQRAVLNPSQSTFDKIMLVPTAGTANVVARPGTPPAFSAPPPIQQVQPDPDDNPAGDVPPDDDRPGRRGGPGAVPGRAQPFEPQQPAQPQAPTPANPSNPFGVQPGTGSARPGTITPVPQQPAQRPRSQPDNEP